MKRIKKIWVKMAIINFAFILLAFIVCGIVQISYAKNRILITIQKQVLDEQLIIEDIFFEMTKSYIQEETDSAAYESGIINCFSQAAEIVNSLPAHNRSDFYYYYDGKTNTAFSTKSVAILTHGSFLENDSYIGETLYSSASDEVDLLGLLKSGKKIKTDAVFNEYPIIYINQTLSTRKIDNRYKVIASNNVSIWSNVSESYEYYCIGPSMISLIFTILLQK